MKTSIPVAALIGMLVLAICWLLMKPSLISSEDSHRLPGSVEIGGSLNVLGTKNFRIDHPLDPENRYLVHFASEGPEPFNVYAGRQFLDDAGMGWVLLPPWFEEVNTEYRYQVTAIGSPAPDLHIMREIDGNRFQIGGGPAGVEVSWEVRTRRNDRTMQRLKPEPEINKPAHMRGSFLDPVVWEM